MQRTCPAQEGGHANEPECCKSTGTRETDHLLGLRLAVVLLRLQSNQRHSGLTNIIVLVFLMSLVCYESDVKISIKKNQTKTKKLAGDIKRTQ